MKNFFKEHLITRKWYFYNEESQGYDSHPPPVPVVPQIVYFLQETAFKETVIQISVIRTTKTRQNLSSWIIPLIADVLNVSIR